jgi:hypothetical protein
MESKRVTNLAELVIDYKEQERIESENVGDGVITYILMK